MKPGEDGVFPSIVFHNGRYEYGTLRQLAISSQPVFTRFGYADSITEASKALEALGWELEGNPAVSAIGKRANLPTRDGT